MAEEDAVADDLMLFHRTLPDGRIVDVTPLTYGRARLHVGPADDLVYTDEW